jgi:hypothetical protein
MAASWAGTLRRTNGRFAAAGFGPVSPIPHALPDHHRLSNAAATCAGIILDLTAAPQKNLIPSSISQFNGNIDLIDLSRNRCLIPNGSITLVF